MSQSLPSAGPVVQLGDSSRGAWNGSTPGAVGLPSGVSGASSVTAMPMSSYEESDLVSYSALLRSTSPGFTRTPQRGRPRTPIEKSHELRGPPSLLGSFQSQ